MTVKKISLCDAEKFHSASRHGTFFSQPEILERIFDFVDWWGYFQGSEIACAWPIVLDQDRMPIKNYHFSYYIGPMWAFKLPEYPAHKSLSLTNKVYNSFLDIFSQNYSEITYTFPTGLDDLRPFIWRNQNNQEERHNIEIKYTAKIDLISMDLILRDYRQVRRWELKNSILTDLEFVYNDFEVTDIMEFYGENIPPDKLQLQADKLNHILHNYLSLDASLGLQSIKIIENSTGQTVAFALLGIHKGVVNVIINNVSKKYKQNKSYLVTYLNHLIIKKFLEEGNISIDFNGANSPVLADNKHSFGARAYSYFTINSIFRFT